MSRVFRPVVGRKFAATSDPTTPPAPAPRLSTTTCLPSRLAQVGGDQPPDHIVAAAGGQRMINRTHLFG